MIEVPEMLLEGLNGSLRLKLTQYQFPEITDSKWDSNWLIVFGEVYLDGRGWQFNDACLTTFEVVALANWLVGVANGNVRGGISFVEPNLQFELKGQSNVRVSFTLECAPPWAVKGEDWDKHGFEISIGADLAEAAKALQLQLLKFPYRGSAEI